MVKAMLISYYAKVTSMLNLWALAALALCGTSILGIAAPRCLPMGTQAATGAGRDASWTRAGAEQAEELERS